MGLRLIDSHDYLSHFSIEEDSDIHLFMSHTKPRILRDGLKPDASLKLFAIVEESKDIGRLWLEDITDVDGKLGIYINSEQYRGKGIGEKAISEALELAFHELHLERVYLNVRGKNTRAINCYKKCGFEIIEDYGKQRFADGSIQNAYRLECSQLI